MLHNLAGCGLRVLCRQHKSVFCFQIRCKHRQKKKWAKSQPQLTATQLALGYFDSFYKPVFGSLWASMRVALLSQQKYGVLINNYVSTEGTQHELFREGAFDIVEQAIVMDHTEAFHNKQKRLMEQFQNTKTHEEPEYIEEKQFIETDRTDLSYFMPTKRVVSQKEQLADMELQQGFMQYDDELTVYPDSQKIIPQTLKMLTHDRGQVALFSPAKRQDANRLNYYIMDASSILPVIALDLRPNNNVLDLCAAPGGKTLAMLQTGLPASIICVDNSSDRIRRLREVLHLYTPPSILKDKVVQTVHGNGVWFANEIKNHMKFDKILVDVPCYTDRHVLQTDENNIFLKSRQRERLQIQETQKKLLSAALACIKPGGTVVYSTCTLSMPQNDGVVQAAVDEIHETTDFKIAIVDTSGIADKFRMTFDFYQKCRYGQLVLPNLTSNFGPTYFCKMIKHPS